ncbi:hypothetical protein F7725_007267 [Dissostichus mawsoni]|uniref:Uncharacterized protein n=1 Tax=Dissostichus mawsoni TaxID=36200 RepID=A0A7J5XWC1_DISMA|nr:hypothetical protein F7725_007267 [Dissostichus mawsoni]
MEDKKKGVRTGREGQRGRGLAEGAPHGGHCDGAEGPHGAGQLRVHGGQVGAAVQAGEVGGGAGVALGVGRRLAVAHGVGGGPLHAGGRGGQRVGQGGDGRAPDGHGRVSIAGARDQAGPCLGGGGAVGAGGVRPGSGVLTSCSGEAFFLGAEAWTGHCSAAAAGGTWHGGS